MLEYLRNAADKPVAKILIGILAFSFVGWGVAEWIFGGATGDSTLVRVGGETISVQQYNNARSQELSKMSKEEQRAMYADAVAGAAFANKVLADLTAEQMALNRADDLGFVVTERRIADDIREMPEFQQNGKFSPIMFDVILGSTGLTEADVTRILRSSALRSMVLGPVAEPVPVADFAVVAAYNARHATRDIEYATVNYSDFKVGVPTDEQLRAYYDQNPHVVAEVRTVSYVLVPAKMDQPDAYDAALNLAQKLEDDIIGGTEMSAAASKHGAKYVALGGFAKDKRPVDTILTDSMMTKLFNMDEGMESELIETKQGFVIARVDKVVPAHNAEFDNVKKGLVSEWTQAEQKKHAYVRANEILTAAKQGGAVQMKKASVARASGAPTDVLVAAFNNDVDSIAIAPGSDAFYVVRVAAETMPKVDSAKMTNIRKDVKTMSARAISDDYNSFLKRRYPVKVNKKVYGKIFAE